MHRLERIIQGGLLTLLALMPFHAFLSVWLGSLVGHQAVIQSWKEVLLVVLGGLAVALVLQQPERLQRLRQPGLLALGGFAVVALAVTAITRPSAVTMLFGFKTDLEFLIAGLIAILVSSPLLVRRAITASLVAGGVVVAFGLCQIFLLPADFLTHFGYGPGTIAPFLTLDPAVKSLRFASTLGGPNQLGAYLTIIIALSAAIALRRSHWWWLVLTAASGVVIFHTYSRAAWVGAAIAVVIALVGGAPQRWRKVALMGGGVVLVGGLALVPTLLANQNLQYYLLHSSARFHDQRGSDFEHLASLQTGISAVMAQPWGHGLGTAGPAVFHTGSGVIIENYYLQIGYEAGLLGMVLFVGGVILVGWRLARRLTPQPLGVALVAALAGISVNALVLPAWTDSTTALVAWILVGIALGSRPAEPEHV